MVCSLSLSPGQGFGKNKVFPVHLLSDTMCCFPTMSHGEQAKALDCTLETDLQELLSLEIEC